jgi:arsenate reductase-like glutaredoxin family protein
MIEEKENAVIENNIQTIIDHKPVKNIFIFLVKWNDDVRPNEWLKKTQVDRTLIDAYVDTLPKKTLRTMKDQVTQATESLRRSKRLQNKLI